MTHASRRAALAAALDSIGTDEAAFLVHRDLGPGFTHQDGPDCACSPTLHRVRATVDVEQLQAAVEAAERESEA
jgi:hypothetical protein